MLTIGLIGDSHAKVVFRSMKKMLPSAGFDPIFIRAENGWSLKKHIKEGTLDQLKKARPQVILASLGGNNHTLDENRYKKSIDELIQLAKSIGSKIVWVGPTTSSTTKAASTEKRHAWTHRFLQKYLPSKNIDYINIREFTKTGQRGDGVHYPSSFYKKWAELVTNQLEKLQSKLKGDSLFHNVMAIAGVMTLTTVLVGGAAVYARRKGSSFRLPYSGRGRDNSKQAVKIAKHLDGLVDKYKKDPSYYFRGKQIPSTGEILYKSEFTLPHDILDIGNVDLPSGITSPKPVGMMKDGVNPFNWQFAAPLNWGQEQYYLLDKATGIVYVVASKHGYKYFRNGGGDDFENVWWRNLKPEHKEFFVPVLTEKVVDGYKVYTMPYVSPTPLKFDFHKALGDWSLGSILSYNGEPVQQGMLMGKPVISLYGSDPYQIEVYKTNG